MDFHNSQSRGKKQGIQLHTKSLNFQPSLTRIEPHQILEGLPWHILILNDAHQKFTDLILINIKGSQMATELKSTTFREKSFMLMRKIAFIFY